MSTGQASARPSAAELRWAWQLVAARVHGPAPDSEAGSALSPVAPTDPPLEPVAVLRATSVLIARLARRLAGSLPPRAWVPELLVWVLDDIAGTVSPPAPSDRWWGLPLAVGVLTAAVHGHDMPSWLDQHARPRPEDLPACTDVCWAVAYALDATHDHPGLADLAVADLLHPDSG